MNPAILRVRQPSGRLATFEAELTHVQHGIVTATGRWTDDRQRRRRTYSWRGRDVVEVRWLQHPTTREPEAA